VKREEGDIELRNGKRVLCDKNPSYELSLIFKLLRTRDKGVDEEERKIGGSAKVI